MQQAIDALPSIKFAQELRNLIAQIDLRGTGSVTLLYSGSITETNRTGAAAQQRAATEKHACGHNPTFRTRPQFARKLTSESCSQMRVKLLVRTVKPLEL
jgi:hypothetical protein